MTLGALYSLATALEENEKKIWKQKIENLIPKQVAESMSFEVLISALYSVIENNSNFTKKEVTAYGAGNMAQKYIPQMAERFKIAEVWDAYTKENTICNVPIARPKEKADSEERLIVVFIDDRFVRYGVCSELRKKGYESIYYFRDYLKICDAINALKDLKTEKQKTLEIIKELFDTYGVIDGINLPVVFSVLNRRLKCNKINSEVVQNEEPLFSLEKRLKQVLIVEDDKAQRFKNAVETFLDSDICDYYSLLYALELLLRNMTANRIKTVKRPMRMVNDNAYDEFVVFETIKEALLFVLLDKSECLSAVRIFQENAKNSIPMRAVCCYFYIECGMFQEGLENARKAMKIEPNNLLANEAFYQVALACKDNDIYVDEPIPNYDLSERFCWSGLNFVWCGGFDKQTERAELSPCFRPLQCAARPGGEFWSGEDWKEFRRSVTDGTFRYCQKNQCPNIVAGWLPKKSDCTEEWLKRILEGDYEIIPPIEELHFSYDNHCNLKCPSCRLEIETNTKEQNKKLDELYEKNLEPLMKSAKHMTLSGCGEAMISPHSKKVLQSFSKESNKELVVELRTNMTAINQKTWNELGEGKEVIRHITASIDAAEKNSFEKLRYPAKWDVVIDNLRFVQSLRNAGEIDMFEFHVVIQKDNVRQLCDIVKMAIDYDADAVTFSRLINWRGMSEAEYQDINPFWVDHPLHLELLKEMDRLEKMREQIENNEFEYGKGKKKVYINIHFSPDPSDRYNQIRIGKLKIR